MTSTYPKSEFSPDIVTPQGPAIGGDVYLVGREERDLPVLQSRERVHQAAIERRRAEERAHSADAELAAMKLRHKEEQKQQEARAVHHREVAAKWDKVATGYHADEPVEVELRANARTSTMHFVRTDTGQQIDSRPLYADEVQSVIPDLEDPNQLNRLASLLRCLPATELALAMNESLSVAADEALALLRAGQLRGWCTGGKGKTWTVTEVGTAWIAELGTAIKDDESDVRTVVVYLSMLDDGVTTARRMATALGDGWSKERTLKALDDAREKGYVTGTGGERSKRTITEAGRDFSLPF